MIQCDITGLYIIDKYVCLSFAHPYISILIVGFVSMFIGIIYSMQLVKDDDEKKPSVIKELFSTILDGFKGLGK